jgi:transposase
MNDPEALAAFAGIDWADKRHVVCLATGHGDHEIASLDQSPEAIDAWAQDLHQRFDGRPIGVCIESRRGALISALLKYPWLVLYPINPRQLSSYRDAVNPSGAKDDDGDAGLLCEFLRLHRQQLRPLELEDVATREIRGLAEGRRKLVDLRTKLGNQLRQQLKECFPQALELAGKSMYAEAFLKLLAKFPSFKALQRASPRKLVRYLPRRRKAEDESADGIDPRVTRLRASVPLVDDRAIVAVGTRMIEALVQQLLALNESIRKYDQDLASLMETHPDAELFRSLPGAGAAMAPRLIAAFGADRQRFATAEDVQTASGIAPITVQSGKSRATRRRRACSKFVRQTFHEFADHSLKKSEWALACYRMLRARGMRHHAALRGLAFKWIRILFRCWQNRTPYDETRYLQALKRTNSPLLAFLAAA